MSKMEQKKPIVLSFDEMNGQLSPRSKESHKGDFGHALLVGGNAGFSGAICLASEAALRVGAGLVSVATRGEHAGIVTMRRPEVMAHGVNQRIDIAALIRRCNAIGLGPGLGQTAWSNMLFEAVLERGVPAVIDADALNLLSKQQRKSSNWVLTPHVGEAARLLGCSVEAIQDDRVAAIQSIQQRYGGVVVLKGAGSLVFDGNAPIYTCKAGNPGMASGGMGDVLTGVITGLIAQGHSLLSATKMGVLIHAMAGDRAAKQGERGLLASDLMPHIRELVNEH